MLMSTLVSLSLAMAVGAEPTPRASAVTISSVAVRVHRTEAMLDFYTEAFGLQWQTVELPGMTIYEGTLDNMVIQFVPIREDTDFDGFANFQLGFTVPDIERVIQLAEDQGGRFMERQAGNAETPERAAIRDPDGNTIELSAFP